MMLRKPSFAACLVAAGCASAPLQPAVPNSPLEAGWKGERVCELLFENEDLRTLRCTFPPGVGHERHFHAPHWGYALSGGTSRITEAAGVREVTTPTGASYWNPGIPWHEIVNIGETTQVYLIIEPKSAQE
jgi:hypothetical protein